MQVLLNAWESLPIGGAAVEKSLEKLISETGQVEIAGERKSLTDSNVHLSAKQLEDIKGLLLRAEHQVFKQRDICHLQFVY